MKIGYFVGKYPYASPVPDYEYGGLEVAAQELAVSMSRRGHNIHVFTTSAGYKKSIEKRENLTIYRYGTNVRFYNRNLSLGLLFKPLGYEMDVLHLHVGSSPFELFAALLYIKKRRKPLVITYHGDVIPSRRGLLYRSSVYLYNATAQKLLDYAYVIISPSRCYINASVLLKKYEYKAISIPNGINFDDFTVSYFKKDCRKRLKLSPDKNIILFVGVLHTKKGPDVLIKAMPRILNEHPNTELVLIGHGAMRYELEKLAKETRVQNSVVFTGYIEERLKPLYYKAADVFCLPSTITSESFGIVNLEAMASGIPVVASRIGGIPDIVKNGENGLLMPPEDSQALADSIIFLLDNEGVRQKMGENGRRKAENYTWDKVAQRTETVYKKLLRIWNM